MRTFRVYVLDDFGLVSAPAVDIKAVSVEDVVESVTPRAGGHAFEVKEVRDLVLHVNDKIALKARVSNKMIPSGTPARV